MFTGIVTTSAPPNNGMHPTADTLPFMNSNGAGRRVMPGVSLLLTMRRQLSSAMTVFTKFIFTAVFLSAALGMFTLFLIMPVVAGWPFVWPAALFSLAWGGVAIWCCLTVSIPLKVVSVDGRLLRVSNFLKEVAIPISDVASVEQVEEFRFKLIVLSLKAPTEFGRQIKFMPPTQLKWWREHPVAGELRTLIESQEASNYYSKDAG